MLNQQKNADYLSKQFIGDALKEIDAREKRVKKSGGSGTVIMLNDNGGNVALVAKKPSVTYLKFVASLHEVPPYIMIPEIEKKMIARFHQIDKIFSALILVKKKFFSSRYLINRLSQLDGYDDITAFFPLPKYKSKPIEKQNELWDTIAPQLEPLSSK